MKQIACLLLCLLLCCTPAAMAEEAVIHTDVRPHEVSFSFDLPDQQFVYVKFDTQRDSGSQILYSEDGHFEGTCSLPGTWDEARIGLNVYSVGGRELLQSRFAAAADPEPQGPAAGLPAQQASNRIQNLTLSCTGTSLSYRFQVPGRDTLTLRCKSAQEWHLITLYAGANYVFEGEVPLPCTYPDDSVTVLVYTPNGALLYEDSVRMPYTVPDAPTALKSTRLRGVTVCVDPGHQRTTQVETVQSGPNFNSTTTTTIGMAHGTETKRMESQVVLEIGMLLRNALMAEGATVITTRETQETFVGMLERSGVPNAVQADFVLRLHCNSRSSNPDVQGIEVYCPLSSSYARKVADEAGYRKLGETMLNALQRATGMHKGTCTLNDTYVGNNWSMMPSFLIEMGYMTNFAEDLLLSCPAYQQRLVNGMVEGIYQMAILRGIIK